MPSWLVYSRAISFRLRSWAFLLRRPRHLRLTAPQHHPDPKISPVLISKSATRRTRVGLSLTGIRRTKWKVPSFIPLRRVRLFPFSGKYLSNEEPISDDPCARSKLAVPCTVSRKVRRRESEFLAEDLSGRMASRSVVTT